VAARVYLEVADLLALVTGSVGHLADLADLPAEVALLVRTDYAGQRPHRRELLSATVSLLEDLGLDFMLRGREGQR